MRYNRSQTELTAARVLGPLGIPVTEFDATPARESWAALHESRKRLRVAAQSLMDKIDAEKRDQMTEAEEAAHTLIVTAVGNITREIERRVERGTRDPLGHAWNQALGSSPASDSAAGDNAPLRPNERLTDRLAAAGHHDEGVPIGRLLRASALGDWSGLEQYRISGQMSVGTGAEGGFVTPGFLSSRIIDLARARMRVIEAGALTIPIRGATAFATIEQDPQPGWRGENQDIPEGVVLLGSRTFAPQTLAVLVKSSVELVEDAPNVSMLIEQSIASALALELDRMCLFGDGIGKPLGLYNTEAAGGVNRIQHNGPLTDFSPLSRAVEEVRNRNAEAGAFILSARTDGELDRLVDMDGNPMRPPRSVSERQLLVTNQVPNDLTIDGASPPITDGSAIFTGQWEDFFVAMRTDIVIEATRVGGDAMKKLQVLIRAYLRADAFAVRPTHFTIIDGITPPAP